MWLRLCSLYLIIVYDVQAGTIKKKVMAAEGFELVNFTTTPIHGKPKMAPLPRPIEILPRRTKPLRRGGGRSHDYGLKTTSCLGQPFTPECLAWFPREFWRHEGPF